jgi:hypothetical protein
VVNYSLRPAKNIERKMMLEVFARLSAIKPLAEYRYVGFGSEFFNDFALFHQGLGIREMISIERDAERIERCEFNKPYKCVEVRQGTATTILPTLSWSPRSIVWMDYTEKLDEAMLADLRFLVSQVRSGSFLAWSVNAEPWNGDTDEDTGDRVKQSDWPARRLDKLKGLVGKARVRSELKGSDLAQWGLANEFYAIIMDELARTLNDHNDALAEAERLTFSQAIHFRYADGQRMLTVGGLLANAADAKRIGSDPFAGLSFARNGRDAFEIKAPTLTGREVRFLNRHLPHDDGATKTPTWLSEEDAASFRDVYRYYPIFAESEL